MVSVIIPTCNRPQLLKRSVVSILNQTYRNIEVIVVDDGTEVRADTAIQSLHDARLKYIQHLTTRGGSAARNTGIRASQGEFIAFQDDDDEWLAEKLEVQMRAFEPTPPEVGFCFCSAVSNQNPDGVKPVQSGVSDYHESALKYFKGMLMITLIFKREVFDDVGLFDESFPSHQEAELMIRVTKKYQGLGINKVLAKFTLENYRQENPTKFMKKIRGREMILEKHMEEFKHRPKVLAKNYFWLGTSYRDFKDYNRAMHYFGKAFAVYGNARYFLHRLSMIWNGVPYRLLKLIRK